MRPIRIAYVDHAAALGGAEVALCNLVAGLNRHRWDPLVLLGGDGALVNRLARKDVQVVVLPLPQQLLQIRQSDGAFRSLTHPHVVPSAASYVRHLAKCLRANKVDLVHANSLKASVLGSAAAWLARIPSIWQIHSMVAPPMMSKSGVRFMRALARMLPRQIIANSKAVAACFDVGPDKITVIPCGVDPNGFRPNGHKVGAWPRVGMISRFAPIKGQHVFLDAVERICSAHPTAEFVIGGTALFGEESYEAQVRERAARGAGSRRIQFPGFVDDVPGLLQSLDIVVHPSVQAEGFGQIIVEAMLCGKPVVASAAGGSAELVEDGVTGRLVAPGDAEALTAAIAELLDDPARAIEMGRRGREFALARYDIRQTVPAIEDVYERALARA